MLIQLHKILDVAQCYEILRTIRWAEGVTCTTCESKEVVKNGKDSFQKECQHYKCKYCKTFFDDVTETIFSGSHQGVHRWITVLYLMNLNVSMRQIASELDVSEETAQSMCATIREGVAKKPTIVLSGAVEADECYVITGYKGQPHHVIKAGRKPRRRRLKGKRGRETSADEKKSNLWYGSKRRSC